MASDRDLSSVLSEFARTLVTDFPIQAILDHLVRRIVEIMPITGAGVTLIEEGTAPRYIASSNASALSFERLQTKLDEGPCLAAFRTGEAVAVPDLRQEHRFPVFAAQADRMGLRAVTMRRSLVLEMALPLFAGLVVGASTGMIGALVVTRYLDPLPTIPPDPISVLPWAVIAAAAVGLVAVATIGGRLASNAARGVPLGEVLRVAE